MDNPHEVHPYAGQVVEKLNPDIKESLSEEQMSEIKRVVSQELLSGRKHRFDVRGVVHLLFVKLYYVVLVGVDRRTNTVGTATVEGDRRAETSLVQQAIFWTIMSIYFAGFIGFFVYFYIRYNVKL